MNRNDHRKRLLAFALLIHAAAALAQGPVEEEDLALVYGDKATVSIATGSQQDLRRAPAVATVITAEDIQAIGATSLDEVMETVPGVHVSHTAANYTSAYSFRGINGNPINPQVLVLQNGIAVNSIYRGDRGEAAGGVPLENVARIEIIRGPGSALYGADAFAGVINIITKTAADIPGTEVGARAGSFNSQDVWLQHGGKTGDLDIAGYLRIGRTDGFEETVSADAATRLGKILGVSASLAPGPVHTGVDAIDASFNLGYQKWRLHAAYAARDMELGAGVSSALDPVGREKSERISADVSWTDPQVSEQWGLGFVASYMTYSEDAQSYNLFPPGTTFPAGNVFPNGMIGSPGRWERQLRLAGNATYSGFAGHSLRLGLGHEDLDLYKVRTLKNFRLNETPGPLIGVPIPTGAVIDYSGIQPHVLPHRRMNNYFYAQDEWHFARDWTLTAGLRRDSFSDFGATTNPRLALVWDAALDLTAKLLYGRAFRAPSVGEQYGVNPVANGNPDLKPESIRTLEAAFSWQARENTQLNLSIFKYDMRDAIRAVPNATTGTGSTFANTGKLSGKGAELEVVWDVSRTLRLSGNYANQKSTDEATQTDVGYVPHHHLYARADWRFAGDWQISPQLNWVADRKRASGDTRPDVPDYRSVDLTLRTARASRQWNFSASIRNLFDATILEPTLFVAPPTGRTDVPTSAIPNDLPQAGRSLYLQATLAL